MPFQTEETSVEDSSPVELYAFTYPGENFYYTSGPLPVTYDSRDYIPVPGLSRSAITDVGEINKSALSLTAPDTFDVARLFEVAPPSDVVELVVRRLHRGDAADARIIWLGRVLNVSWQSGYSTIMCESLYTRLRSPGLRRIYSRNCPHVLYGAECGASQIAFASVVVMDTVPSSPYELAATGFGTLPAGSLAGGKLIWEPGGGIIERRGIRRHNGTAITLTHPIPGILSTSTVTVYPGCDRTRTICESRFSNLVNFGGFPYIPRKNPFGQSSVF